MAAFLIELLSTRSFSDPRPLTTYGSASSRFFESSSISQLVRERTGLQWEVFVGQTPIWSLLSTYHWPELSYGAVPPCERGHETELSWVARRERKWNLASVSVIMPFFFFLLADMRFEPWQLGTKDWLYTSTFYLLTMNSGSKSEKNVDCTSFFVNFIPTYNCMWLLGCCAWEFCQSCCLQKTITMRTNIECLLCSRHDCMHFTCSALIVTITQEIGNYLWSHFPGKEAGYVSKAT